MNRRNFVTGAMGSVIGAGAVKALAQQGTLSANIVATNLKVSAFTVLSPPTGPASASIGLSQQTAGGVEVASRSVSIPNSVGSATVGGLITAMMTARATETGSNPQRMAFRVIGYLFDTGCIPEINAVSAS